MSMRHKARLSVRIYLFVRFDVYKSISSHLFIGEAEDWGTDVIIAQIGQYIETLKRAIKITPEMRDTINKKQHEYKRRVTVSML